MAPDTLPRPTLIPMPDRRTLTRDLEASRVLPILELVLFVVGDHAQHPGDPRPGLGVLLEGWSRVATTVLEQARTEQPALAQHARKVGTRTMRMLQGYDSAAKDKASQVLAEYVSGSHGVDRELTDEELIALNNGLVHAFAGYATYLDHVAAALPGGRI